MTNNELCQLMNKISNIAIFAIDSKNNISYWNKAAQDLYGYTKDEIEGKNLVDKLIPKHQIEYFKSDLEKKKLYTNEQIEYLNKDGSIVMAFTNTIFIEDVCYFVTYDLSKTKSKRSISEIVDPTASKDEKMIVISFDKSYKITSMNIFAQRLTGFSQKEVLGKDFFKTLIPPVHIDRVKDSINKIFKDRRSHSRLSFPMICKDGEKRVIKWEKVLLNKNRGEEFFYLVGVQSSHEEEKLNYLANYDLLTDLPNQNLLLDRIKLAMGTTARLKQNMIVISFNIENFKSINHTFGFDFGNKVLKEVGKRLSSNLRENDIVSRFSADEFIMVFEDIVDERAADEILGRIDKLFKEPFKIDGNSINLDINQGLCFFPDHGNDPKTLIKNANIAMNYAKKEQKRYQIFTASIYNDISNKQTLEKNLITAIKENQFFVEYQPQIDANSKKIVGAEALVRWNHPKLSHIPPVDFIPLAEESGLIDKIGKIVLKEAVEQTKKWHEMGFNDLIISVNISGVQLFQNDLISFVEDTLRRSSLDPKYLNLELTESVLMENINLASKTIKVFKDQGIRFAIDDFGTGYSSFQYLSKLPISELKIDKSFIDDFVTNQNDHIIVDAIISMAHKMGLNVIAEGVEDEKQYKELLSMKCDRIQGYYFSKPLRGDDFTKLLEKSIEKQSNF